jgi:hypothetical protein
LLEKINPVLQYTNPYDNKQQPYPQCPREDLQGQKYDSFYGHEFRERLTPGQIITDGVVKFKQAGKSQEDGNVGHHGDEKVGRLKVGCS